MYDLNICYATDGGAKTQKLNVNGNAAGDLALSNHTDFSESNVARIKLNAGKMNWNLSAIGAGHSLTTSP